MINETTSAIEGTQVSLCSLAKVAMNDRLALESSIQVKAVSVQELMQLMHQAKWEGQFKNVKKKSLMVFFSYSGLEPWEYVWVQGGFCLMLGIINSNLN